MSDTSTNTIIQNFLGTKTGKALLYIILIGVGVVLIRQIFKAPNEDSKIPIITILEKVIKIQQLELVNFYSDHILVLGDPGELENVVINMEKDTVIASKNVTHLKSQYEIAKLNLAGMQDNMADARAQFSSLKKKMTQVQTQFSQIPGTYRHFQNSLDTLDFIDLGNLYGNKRATSIQRIYAKIKKDEAREGNRKERKAERKDESVENDSLRTLYKTIRADLIARSDSLQDVTKTLTKTLNYSGLKKDSTKYANKAQHLSAELTKAIIALNVQRKSAEQAQTRVQQATDSLETLSIVDKPELVAIVPTTMSTYINLKKVTWAQSKKADSTFIVTIDSILVDQVEVLLDSSQYFGVQQGGHVPDLPGGLIKIVFEEIRLNVGKIQHDVEQKALKNGIIHKSCQKARKHFEDLLNGYGYKVIVKFRSGPC